jgi:hypothetical protein
MGQSCVKLVILWWKRRVYSLAVLKRAGTIGGIEAERYVAGTADTVELD